MKLPWSRSTKSKKLQITQGAMVADGEEQQPASRQQSTVSSYDDSNKQVDTEYGSEATTDAQDQLTIDSRATSAYSTDKVTVSNADTDQIELSHAHNGVASQDDDTQTLAEFFEQDRKVTETGAPDAALSKLPSAAAAETPKAHEKKDSLPESIKYDENGEPILHLHYTKAQVELIASEIYDQTVAETTLGLFVDWIREKPENFELATKHIRELATDRVGLRRNVLTVERFEDMQLTRSRVTRWRGPTIRTCANWFGRSTICGQGKCIRSPRCNRSCADNRHN